MAAPLHAAPPAGSPSGAEARRPVPASPRRALVLVAHGSRREGSNDEVRRLTAHLRSQAEEHYPVVELGFLELAEPGLDRALETAISRGVAEVVVLPYFLAAGRHVREDVPAVVEAVRLRHPEVYFRVTPHLGATEAVAEILLRLAEETPTRV